MTDFNLTIVEGNPIVEIKETPNVVQVVDPTSPQVMVIGIQGPEGPGADLTTEKGFIVHGSNANVTRLLGYGSIEWIGSVQPNNAINGDTWINTA